jgi:hypothetical protein
MKFNTAASISSLLIIFNSSFVFPQLSFSARVENYYDDNIYNNYDKTSDFVHSASADLGYDFESDDNNFQIYYAGNLSYFRENIFKTSNSHKFGIVNTYFLSEEGNPLNAGINYAARNNRDELSVYDLSLISGYLNYRHFINETDYFLTGYLFFYNDYKNFNSFTHFEHRGFAKYSSTLESKTTLSIGTELDFKIYKLKYNSPDIADNITQWKSYFQASQNIFPSTGLSGYIMYRKNLSTGNRYISFIDYVYYEEEIFNDAYSNDGIETGASITQMISDDAAVKAEFLYAQRNFNSLYAALIDGTDSNKLREDDYFAFGTELQFDLSGWFNGLGISFNYNYLLNKSNDYFYEYDNNLTSVTLELNF